MLAAQWIQLVAAAYALVGALVGAPFVCSGAARVDSAAKGSTPGFRMIIFPGAVLLWPVVLWKWILAFRPERNE